MVDSVRIRQGIVDALLSEAWRTPEQECSGLLAGKDGVITTILPATNVLNKATAYEIAPEELFSLFKQIRVQGLQLLGIYHSHPTGLNTPSATDVRTATYPEAAYFIVNPASDEMYPVRAFRIRDERFTELTIQII